MENINVIEILIYMINFLVTFALLYMLLFKPVSTFLAARKARIVQSLTDAEATRNEAKSILNDAKEELAGTAEKARQLSHTAIENAARDADEILDEAREEADLIIKRTHEQMAAERQAALERAYTELISLSKEMSSRIISREVTLEDNQAIVDAFFNEAAKKYKVNEAAKEEIDA